MEKGKVGDCIFCRIASGKTQEEVLYQDKDTIAVRDVHPRTPTHVLIILRHHYNDFDQMMEREPELLLSMGKAVEKLADELGIRGQWYTWGFHCGGKQSVNHVHAQLLAGMKTDELVL